MSGDGCICKGNWRNIIKDTQDLFDRRYLDMFGFEHIFVGVLHSSDDYYYCMWAVSTGKTKLLSCVGSIESFGYKIIEGLKVNAYE